MNIIITIDVEAHRGKTPIETFIWGRAADGKKYGLEMIVNTLKKYNYKALFFVDFAEAFDYGRVAITKVVDYLVENGQYVGLHLHPDHFGDKKRTFLWEYTYIEQLEMITECAKLFEEIVGKPPAFFRAGKFGANDDTICILERLGIHFDCSSFYNHQWCKISKQYMSNSPYKISENVIEIPVSVFQSVCIFGKMKRIDQVDLGNNMIENRNVFNSQYNLEDNVILTGFFHSFSFFPYRKNPEKIRFSKVVYNCFIKNLDLIEQYNIEVVEPDPYTINTLFKNKANEESDNKLPISGNILLQFAFLIKRALSICQTNKKAMLLIGTLLGICVVVLVLLLIFII